MPFTIDEAFLPATLTAPPMTDQQFADFCAEHPRMIDPETRTVEVYRPDRLPETLTLSSPSQAKVR